MRNIMKLAKICERAEKESPETTAYFGSRASRLMDLQSAQEKFYLRLDDLLKADDENFYHDVFGIWYNSNRNTYPATFGAFVPRFAGNYEEERS